MITVKYLKQEIADLPDEALVYAYQGESDGIVVIDARGEELAFIHANESAEIEGGQ